MIHPDELFSYWIFAWYIVYMIGYTQYSPKFALYISVIVNLYVFIAMVYFNVRFKRILYYMIVIMVFKFIPLWTLRNKPIRSIDIQVTLALFIIYIGWISWKEKWTTIYKGYTDLLQDKSSMPGMGILEYLNIM